MAKKNVNKKNTSKKETSTKKSTNTSASKKTTNKKSNIETNKKTVNKKSDYTKNNELIKPNGNNDEGATEIKKLIYIVIAVVAIFAIVYGITYLISVNKKTKLNVTPSVIDYNEIIVGEILNRTDSDYYVLLKVKDDPYERNYTYYIDNLKENLRFYEVDLGNMFNKNYLADESNLNVENLSEIRFKDTTLLKISNKTIESYYEGQDAIIEYLKTL